MNLALHEWVIIALLVTLLALLLLIAYKLRARLWAQDEQIKGLSNKVAAIVDERILPELKASTLEIQDAISVGSLGLRFPIFLGDASIDSFHARYLLQTLVERRPKTILELGSGSSTVLIARTMQLMGLDHKHISVDHEPYYLEISKRYAKLNGVADHIDFCLCPLEPISPMDWYWYARVPETLADSKIDLLVIDGPPAWRPEFSNARYPALPVLYAHLSDECLIILDDTNRDGERAILNRWINEFPDFDVTRFDKGKGIAVLDRQKRNCLPQQEAE